MHLTITWINYSSLQKLNRTLLKPASSMLIVDAPDIYVISSLEFDKKIHFKKKRL